MPKRGTPIAVGLLAAVAALVVWWAWKQGAYFGGVFYPGAIAAFLLLALLLAAAPVGGRLTGPARLAAGALLGLAAWTLLSLAWSPTPASAVIDAAHTLLYLAMFGLGLWTTHLLGPRMLAALSPLAVGGAAIGIATVVVLATGSDFDWYLHDDATLRFPIGYRNAYAAFLLICLWPVLTMASASGWRWELRALLLGAGTVLLELALLAQSRASVAAFLLAGLAFLALSRERLRAAAALGLVALPALPALPVLLEVFGHGEADASVVPLLRDAAVAIGATAVLSVVLAAAALGWVEPRLGLGRRTRAAIGWGLAALAALAVVVPGSLLVARHGGPVDFVDQRVQEFTREGTPDLSGQAVRFGVNAGSSRGDFWRVAAREGLDRPLLGGGAGSFEPAYLERRSSHETPEDPHNVGFLMLSELGFPGLLLFAAFLAAAVLAGLRSRRLGPGAAALTAGSLAAGTQWMTQASFDWLWSYPAVTAPVLFALGAAASPATLDPMARLGRRARSLAAGALVAVAVACVPFFAASRYLQRAHGETASDSRAAMADFDRAAELNPLDAEPLLARAEVEAQLGESAAALGSLREAEEREPRNYLVHYLRARELAALDRAAALRALREAEDLNPTGEEVGALRQRLAAEP